MLSKKKTAILALTITTALTTGNLAFADSVKDKGNKCKIQSRFQTCRMVCQR